MELIECKCKKSSAKFNCVGEDLFQHELINIEVKELTKGVLTYICKNCNEVVTHSDKAMIIKY